MESTERGQKIVTYNPIQFTEAVQKMTFISPIPNSYVFISLIKKLLIN